ncbi:hypothetical protein [Stenotrophomonas lactitubi]
MKIMLPALALAVVPAGFGDPQAVAPVFVAIVALDLILYAGDLH